MLDSKVISNWTANDEPKAKTREKNHSVNKETKLSNEEKNEILNNINAELDAVRIKLSEARNILADKNLYDALMSLDEAKRSINRIQ
jgi:hypothetical protein